LILGRIEILEILAIERTEKILERTEKTLERTEKILERTEKILETEKTLTRRFALWEFHLEELLGSETASAQ